MSKKARRCQQCGTTLPPNAPSDKRFCNSQCRAGYANLAKVRGAELYHLWYAKRYDRATADANDVWGELCKLSERWRDEDRAAVGFLRFDPPVPTISRLVDKGSLPRGVVTRTDDDGNEKTSTTWKTVYTR